MSQEDDQHFEDEVRRIARARWPSAKYSGAVTLAGKERDGRFETEEVVNFVEATTSRAQDKARYDAKKLQKAVADQLKTNPMKAAKGWFITKDEPTADQRKMVQEAGKGQVTAVSFSQFQQSLVDVAGYLEARSNHFFGSVLDPLTRDKTPTVDYVSVGISCRASETPWDIQQIVDGLLCGKRFALLGDYGAGKSMTLRQIYFQLRKRYFRGGSTTFPIYLNLREHSGQKDAVEVLERHARLIGFDSPASLVRAWRAGFVIFLIDGLDEITTLGAQGLWRKLRESRKRSLEAVRQIIRETSADVGLIVAGREHYFDSEGELRSVLGLHADAPILTLNEFTDEQLATYLGRAQVKLQNAFPAWLPTRPLLVGYIASRGLLENLSDSERFPDPVDGWDFLLDQICTREARIEANLDGQTLRRILERLATMARATQTGLGPLSKQQIQQAFVDICGYDPDEQASLLLQRLPGLGVYRIEDESRTFIDGELADICRARDIFDFLGAPHSVLQQGAWLESMRPIDRAVGNAAVRLVGRRMVRDGLSEGHIRAAIKAAQNIDGLNAVNGDLASICIDQCFEIKHPMTVVDISFPETFLEIDDAARDISGLTYRDCYFSSLEIGRGVPIEFLPRFQSCLLTELVGRVSPSDVPEGCFDEDCEIEKFGESADTVSAIRDTPLSIGERVLLTILRKLYLQSLSGRQENALYRGLDHNEKRLVADVLKCLQSHNLTTLYSRGSGNVWLPIRKELHRVRRIIASPSATRDPAMTAAKQIS